MNCLFYFTLLIGVFSISAVSSQEVSNGSCVVNQIYLECGNSCSEKQCGQKIPDACTDVCKPDCYCESGFSRDVNNKCVREQDCCFVKNESKRYCMINIEPTCREPKKNQAGGGTCGFLPECTCNPDFVRNLEGQCVNFKDCPKPNCTGKNEIAQCGSTCGDLTCERPSLAATSCVAGCINDCYCKEGFVRNCNYECVRPSSCPKCKPNMSYNCCGTSCPATCRNPKQIGVACNFMCNAGCFCNEGYVLNKLGKCILADNCSTADCNANEEFLKSGISCEPNCNTDPNIKTKCIENRSGCFCKKGYVRDSNQRCIPIKECPAKCPTHEHPTFCGTTCEKTCKTSGLTTACKPFCGNTTVCTCDEGYVRYSGQCILKDDCPVKV